MKKAKIYMHKNWAGTLVEDESGFRFQYEKDYLLLENAEPISLKFPLRATEYRSDVLFPFFDGLIPEGWILAFAEKNWKLNTRDRMSVLLLTCKDCIGAVSVVPFETTAYE